MHFGVLQHRFEDDARVVGQPARERQVEGQHVKGLREWAASEKGKRTFAKLHTTWKTATKLNIYTHAEVATVTEQQFHVRKSRLCGFVCRQRRIAFQLRQDRHAVATEADNGVNRIGYVFIQTF